MSTISKKLFTVNEFQRMAETGILSEDDRLELIHGEILKMSPIGTRHAAAVRHANKVLVMCVGDRGVVSVQSDIVLGFQDQPQPDLVVARFRDDFYSAKHPGPDDILLIIEVADSSLEYDQTVKLQLYAEMGIREYWIADLQTNVMYAYSRPQGTSYQIVRTYRRGESIAPRELPDCLVQVDILLP